MLTSNDLYDRAASHGVKVVWADLGERSGIYEDASRSIVLNLCLTQTQTRCTMAHEMSHAQWRDTPVADRRAHEARERRADAEAARMLITPSEYAAAESIAGCDAGALADELGVSRWVVEVWQREARYGRAWTCAA